MEGVFMLYSIDTGPGKICIKAISREETRYVGSEGDLICDDV
jgi:hypothetical protein